VALGAGALHVWFANLDHLLGEVASFRGELAHDERGRAARFHFELDAAHYIASRGVLRRLLGGYVGGEPAGIAFAYGPHGKPRLAGNDEPLHFNVAHSRGVALFAFSRASEIGVDVEHVRPLPDLASVMRSVFATEERAAITDRQPADDQVAAFYRCWTRKEAVLKALGWGLAKPLDSFVVSIDEAAPRLERMDDGSSESRDWQMLHLYPAPHVVGAAAWRGPPLEVDRFAYHD
jgi:4'-phosphopantetheinyl transferase